MGKRQGSYSTLANFQGVVFALSGFWGLQLGLEKHPTVLEARMSSVLVPTLLCRPDQPTLKEPEAKVAHGIELPSPFHWNSYTGQVNE